MNYYLQDRFENDSEETGLVFNEANPHIVELQYEDETDLERKLNLIIGSLTDK